MLDVFLLLFRHWTIVCYYFGRNGAFWYVIFCNSIKYVSEICYKVFIVSVGFVTSLCVHEFRNSFQLAFWRFQEGILSSSLGFWVSNMIDENINNEEVFKNMGIKRTLKVRKSQLKILGRIMKEDLEISTRLKFYGKLGRGKNG